MAWVHTCVHESMVSSCSASGATKANVLEGGKDGLLTSRPHHGMGAHTCAQTKGQLDHLLHESCAMYAPKSLRQGPGCYVLQQIGKDSSLTRYKMQQVPFLLPRTAQPHFMKCGTSLNTRTLKFLENNIYPAFIEASIKSINKRFVNAKHTFSLKIFFCAGTADIKGVDFIHLPGTRLTYTQITNGFGGNLFCRIAWLASKESKLPTTDTPGSPRPPLVPKPQCFPKDARSSHDPHGIRLSQSLNVPPKMLRSSHDSQGLRLSQSLNAPEDAQKLKCV
eukprot:1158537-Pelagomonas_calceolata.AAC.18